MHQYYYMINSFISNKYIFLAYLSVDYMTSRKSNQIHILFYMSKVLLYFQYLQLFRIVSLNYQNSGPT